MIRQSKFVFVVANQDIVFEEFDGEYVILNLASGEYHAVDGSAALIWKLLMDGVCPKSILDTFEAHPNLRVNQIEAFVANLVSKGLIKASDGLDDKVLPNDGKAELLALTTAPKTDMFDDLADLILADPIHDVEEEAGWPVRKPE
ncbi:PqqD family protein [Cohaesibacter celericrescens]|jgi:hypothetical protein|uniref:Pyrroloquinoline quinone biosynthesis protein PqqD n=1 Tax=Cohaesibacter celericrescens TaxID=2067669 RepID=A0A2N5XQ84_9HYPH|nr:PqqD family protein [Cohaesibacter celericrescens]PLW76635.1 pyrroloquinoline quinone biosynthesis protein PqqD [Cohaesibacter celericrescens]